MNDESLDALLRTSLQRVEDSGFTASLMARVARSTHPLEWLEIAVLAGSALLMLAFVPLRAMSDVAVQLSTELANSSAAAIACLAIVFSLFLLRTFETE